MEVLPLFAFAFDATLMFFEEAPSEVLSLSAKPLGVPAATSLCLVGAISVVLLSERQFFFVLVSSAVSLALLNERSLVVVGGFSAAFFCVFSSISLAASVCLTFSLAAVQEKTGNASGL